MMRTCEWSGCVNWSQWIVRKLVNEEWKIIRRLCQKHKEEYQKHATDKDIKYSFVGAEPSGLNNT